MRVGIKQRYCWLLIVIYCVSLLIPFLPAKATEAKRAKLFSIQHWKPVESITWGRTDYPMTNTIGGKETVPIYFVSMYLSITADGANTTTADLYYFVLDNSGSLWIDPDGKFNNCLYDATRDPQNPLFTEGSCKEANRLEGRIRYSVDPKPDNNTQGPYSIEKILRGEQVVAQLKGRKFLLGVLDRVDFLEKTQVSLLDWDMNLPLINFKPLEMHADNVSGNSLYDPFEWIYRTSTPHALVEPGDIRLSAVVYPGSKTSYEPNTEVRPGDMDVGFPLYPFLPNEKHQQSDRDSLLYTCTQKYGFDFFADPIYQDQDQDSMVSPSDIRMLPVNGCLDSATGLRKDYGLTEQDGLILVEIVETKEKVSYALETNYLFLDPTMKLSVKNFSGTSNVSIGISSLESGVQAGYKNPQSIAFIQEIQPNQAGYLGFEWFLDNGVNNKMYAESLQSPVANNLSDDFTELGESEEIWGQYSRTGDMDYRVTLSALRSNIRYYDISGSGFGTGTPFYRDNDNSFTVSAGDERLIDVDMNSGTTNNFYSIGSIVSQSDSDAGLMLQDIPPQFRYSDVNPRREDLSRNGEYDIQEPIYKKNALSLYPGYVEVGDFRITTVSIGPMTYSQGTFVAPSVFYYHESRVWGLHQGLSGDFRLLDVPIIPGKTTAKILGKPDLKVEQTSLLEIQVEPLKKGEKMILLVDGSMKRSELTRDLMIRKDVEGPFDGIISLTITPYTSSYSEKGPTFPLTFLLYVDTGGFPIKWHAYRDEVLDSEFYESIYDRHIEKYDTLLPYGFYPDTIDQFEQFVKPEDLVILPSKNSISQYDLRFPNMWAKIQDADNPDDVNDPSQIIAPNSDSTFLANYNVQGAGIDYLCTTYGYVSDKPGVLQYFIVQVNRNQTYTIWLWKDTEPLGVLNWGDRLSNSPLVINETPIWANNDCSERFRLDKYDILGTNWITRNDYLGIFDGSDHPLTIEDQSVLLYGGGVQNFGVNVKLETYGTLSKSDPGGDFPLVVLPQFSEQEMNLLIYTTSVLFDYKNSIQHPPYFVESYRESNQYRGSCKLRAPRIEDVNVTNLTVVDHSLAGSSINYTTGENALSPLKDILISAPYNPMVRSIEQDMVVYPGGNMQANRSLPHPMDGYIACPTISALRLLTSPYRKLGGEESPLADYSFYFMVQTKGGEFIRFDADAPAGLRIEKVVVDGPFKIPKTLRISYGSVVPDIGYPLLYDFSGLLTIDRENAKFYQSKGDDWTGRIGCGKDEFFMDPNHFNPLLVRTQVLNYKGFPYVFKIPEITPIQAGRLHITIYLADGTITEIGECCTSEPKIGVPVHGLRIDNLPDSLTPGENVTLKPIVRELEDYKNMDTDYCNSAYVLLWQDRGALQDSGEITSFVSMGAGDSRMQGNRTEKSDHNKDGKISFVDYETEIMGTFDLATNTWAGGVFDGRTFNVQNGVYPMSLSPSSGSLPNQYGCDFNEDHLISGGEECPIYFSAYKFFDDNNDRAFTPLYKERSHEVYLAGEQMIPLEPKEDLVLEITPMPLTAGCTPEKNAEPLTFQVFDREGKAIDLTRGISDKDGKSLIDPTDVNRYLFNDKPFEPLPQYYWLRTDLHNQAEGFDCNEKMIGTPGQVFEPIRIDFSGSASGTYRYYGFCANDEGVFETKVYTPDHLRMGKSWIIVETPTVKYTVSGESPFGPDFIMTAGINRIYRITAEAYDRQGKLITSGRMTPYTTKPGSFDLPLQFTSVPSPYFLHVALPGSLSPRELTASRIFPIRGHGADRTTYYNTTNMQYENTMFSKTALISPNPTMTLNSGWGFGCIYNSPREGVYLFPDLDADGRLTKEDSLKMGEDGKVSFLLFAEDVCKLGMLVGDNDYSPSALFGDVVGKPPKFKDSPLTIRGRFRGDFTTGYGYTLADQVFALDWDSFALETLSIAYPVATLFQSSGQLELGKELLNPDNYDLTYGTANNLILRLEPADSRDLPITEGSIRLQGNKSEAYISGKVRRESDITQTQLTFTPTGAGTGIANLLYHTDNQYYSRDQSLLEGPLYYAIDLHRWLDSARALQILLPAGHTIIPDFETTLTVQVVEYGTRKPVQDATVNVQYPGFNQTLRTDEKGEIEFLVKPKKGDKITIQVTKEDYLSDQILLGG